MLSLPEDRMKQGKPDDQFSALLSILRAVRESLAPACDRRPDRVPVGRDGDAQLSVHRLRATAARLAEAVGRRY